MSKITKAVIPCGGMGSRFFPITKAVPKEILPIIDTPVLSFIIQEAAASGITDVLLILGAGKEAIKRYFTPDPALEEFLLAQGKQDLYAQIKAVNCGVNITFAYQPKPLGSGDALMHAKPFTGKEAFCLALGDDIIHSSVPVMRQLTDVHERIGHQIIGVQHIEGPEIVQYGTAVISEQESDRKYIRSTLSEPAAVRTYKCLGFKEKPAIDQLPSRLACLGRYVLDGRIYEELARTPVSASGELQLTDALNAICTSAGAYAYDFQGRRYDMGNKLESVKAVVEYTLRDPAYKDAFLQFLQDTVYKNA